MATINNFMFYMPEEFWCSVGMKDADATDKRIFVLQCLVDFYSNEPTSTAYKMLSKRLKICKIRNED